MKQIVMFWDGSYTYPPAEKICIEGAKKNPNFQLVMLDRNYLRDIKEWDSVCQKALELRKFNYLADRARWEYVLRHGGLIMDTDVILVDPLPLSEEFIVDAGQGKVDEWIAYVKPASPMARDVVKALSDVDPESLASGEYNMSNLLTDSYNKFKLRWNVAVMSEPYFTVRKEDNTFSLSPYVFAVHLDKYDEEAGSERFMAAMFLSRLAR